jgi:hypothetical protein
VAIWLWSNQNFTEIVDDILAADFASGNQKAKKVRVTGYLLWDDDQNGSADGG